MPTHNSKCRSVAGASALSDRRGPSAGRIRLSARAHRHRRVPAAHCPLVQNLKDAKAALAHHAHAHPRARTVSPSREPLPQHTRAASICHASPSTEPTYCAAEETPADPFSLCALTVGRRRVAHLECTHGYGALACIHHSQPTRACEGLVPRILTPAVVRGQQCRACARAYARLLNKHAHAAQVDHTIWPAPVVLAQAYARGSASAHSVASLSPPSPASSAVEAAAVSLGRASSFNSTVRCTSKWRSLAWQCPQSPRERPHSPPSRVHRSGRETMRVRVLQEPPMRAIARA